MRFTGKELQMLSWMLAMDRRMDHRFSERMIGRRLFRKLPRDWVVWTGFFLMSGSPCYRLTPPGRQGINDLGKKES